MASSVDTDQTAPGSTLVDSIFNSSVTLGNDFSRRHFQMHFFLGALRVNFDLFSFSQA